MGVSEGGKEFNIPYVTLTMKKYGIKQGLLFNYLHWQGIEDKYIRFRYP